MSANTKRTSNDARSVLIFGGAGFVGSNWAAHLLENTAAQVHVFDNLSRPGVRHNLEWLKKIDEKSGRLRVTVGDIRDRGETRHAVRTASEIYHFAAQVAVTTSLEDPRYDFEVNLAGTFNILDAVREAGHRPFLLFTSTNKVYGDLGRMPKVATPKRYCGPKGRGVSEEQPLDFHSPYGCSKGAADQYVHDFARVYGIPAVVFRMSCIAGPRQFGNEDQGWIAHFLFSALQRKPVAIYGDGRQVRDVLYIGDLIRAFDDARLNLPTTAGEIFNVGGGEANSVSLLELIQEIEQLTHLKLNYNFAPSRGGDQLVYVTNYNKLRQHTGWEPQVNVGEVLARMQEWWRSNRELFAERTGLPQATDIAFQLRTA